MGRAKTRPSKGQTRPVQRNDAASRSLAVAVVRPDRRDPEVEVE
jgi:hypothetical protein